MTDNTISDDKRLELERLHEAATRGEWRTMYGGEPCQIGVGHDSQPHRRVADFDRPEDAEFAAAAHNDLPAILARLKETDTENARFVDAIRQWLFTSDDDPLIAACDQAPDVAFWLAARDARMKREGAVMKLLDMSLGGFAWDETGLRHEAEAMLLDAGEHSRYESMMEAAKRLREGGE